MFLSAYFDGTLNINALNYDVMQGDSNPYIYVALTGKPVSQLTERDILRHRRNALERCTGWCKTHNQWISDYEGFEAIYLVRDPRKVIPSYATHSGLNLDHAISMMTDPKAELRQKKMAQHIGRWDDHVQSWKEKARVIKYEDLSYNPEKHLGSLVKGSHHKIREAMFLSNLDNLRLQEQKYGFRECSNYQVSFFNSKKPELDESQRMRIEGAFGETMREMGYL